MRQVQGFYETLNVNTLSRDYLNHHRYVGSIIKIKDSTGLQGKDGIIQDAETCLFLIKQGNSIGEQLVFITSDFGQVSNIDLTVNNTIIQRPLNVIINDILAQLNVINTQLSIVPPVI